MEKFKYYLLSLLIALMCACKEPQQVKLPSKNELAYLIDAVITLDSLPVHSLKAQKIKETRISYPLLRRLRKIMITVPDTAARQGLVIEQLPNINTISIYTLLSNFGFRKKSGDNGMAFSRSEYQYLLYQNNKMKEFTIDKTVYKDLYLIDDEAVVVTAKNNKLKPYYAMSIPILSRNGAKAYLEITSVCGGLCSSAKGIYLEKKNGKWSIISRRELWAA